MKPVSSANEPSTPEEFHDALSQLLLAADDNGINPVGGWRIVDENGIPRFDTETVRLTE